MLMMLLISWFHKSISFESKKCQVFTYILYQLKLEDNKFELSQLLQR